MNKLPLWMARPVNGGPVYRDSWFRMRNQADDAPAEVWIYDAIGMWGVTAGDFVSEFTALRADHITVRINSPGGSVFDGKAIYNVIKGHKAYTTVTVDSLAASAASFIAMAGDEIVTSKVSTWMIHNAQSFSYGDADALRKDAGMLDRESAIIAGIYADRTGLPVAHWQELMSVETWFNADEALAAKLCDRIEGADGGEGGATEMPHNRWDLAALFTYGGRDKAPAPVIANVAEPAPVFVPDSAAIVNDPEWQPDQEWIDALVGGLTIR